MLRRPMMGRGRPGLLGTVARTAVVAGTATATARAMSGWQGRREQERAQRQAAQQAVQEQQQQLDQLQQRASQQRASQQPVAAAGTTPPTAGAAPTGDLTARLRQLAELNASGALSDAEFAAAKAKLLGT